MTKNEFFYTDKVLNENESNKSTNYYDSDGKLTRREVLYSDENANDNGYYREIDYYDGDGKTAKIEIFYTNIFAEKNGFDSVVIYYYDRTPTRVEKYMDKKLVRNSFVSDKQKTQPSSSRAR